MALDSIGISATVSWALSRAVTGFADVTQGPDSLSFSSNSLSTATWTEIFAAEYTLAAAGTQVVDLRTFTDLVGNSVTGTKAMALMLSVSGAATDWLNVKPNSSNGLQWFFGGTAEGVSVPGGGVILFSEGAGSSGTTVDATHKQLLLTNNGAANLTATIAALVSTL